MMSSWNTESAQDSAAFEEQLLILRNQINKVEDQRLAMQRQLDSMSGLKRLFKRRSVNAELKKLELQIESARAEEQSLLADLALISDRVPPETQGLDIGSKRSINLMIIAFAQQLYLQFENEYFASLVKAASEKSAGGVNYGTQHECTQILHQIQKRIEIIEQNSDHAVILQKRAKLIGEKAIFANAADVVPISGSTTIVYDINDRGTVKESEVPVLGENYWGISRV